MAAPYIIIGNGVAGVNAAETIRARDPRAQVIVITDQECEFYSRPALYYYLLGRIEFADTVGRPRGFYRRNRFDLQCATTVSSLDPEARTITCADGAELSYRRILLATGTRGRMLPWVREGVKGLIGLNTLRDVVEITHAMQDAEAAVVVGGGLTSIEIVESLAHHGIKTTFIMRDDRFLAKQMTSEEAEVVHDALRRMGVDVRTGEEVTEMSVADGRVTGVTTKSGDHIPCQIISLAVGIAPNRELAEAAGAEVAAGIVVDDSMRTSLPDVFAAGDCAQVRQADGSAAPAEMLWYVAAHMGRVAGANMTGGAERYEAAPFLNVSELAGVDFCGVGSIVPDQDGVETLWAPYTPHGTARVVLRDGYIVGGCFVGDIRVGDLTRALIAHRARWEELPKDHPLRARFHC